MRYPGLSMNLFPRAYLIAVPTQQCLRLPVLHVPQGRTSLHARTMTAQETMSSLLVQPPDPNQNARVAPLVTPFVNSVDVAWLRGQQTLLGSMISVGKSVNPPKPTLSCANDSPAHLDRDWAIGSVSSFCNSYMGKNASPNMPIEQNYAEGTQENFDNGVGQNTTLSIVVAPECSQNFTQYNIDIDQCNVALNSTIEECDTTGPKDGKHGGKVSYGCIVYANDPQTHPPSPSSTDSSTPSPSADSSHCSINDDCNFRTCPIGPSMCETYGAPGVNEQGLK